eukprot:7881123-Pyramimonas_sp.AAC.1
MGFAEAMNDPAATQARVIELQLESGMGARIPVLHRIMPWVSRRAGWPLVRFAAGQASGKTAYRVNRGKPRQG